MKYAPWVGWVLAIIFIFLYYRSCQAPKEVIDTKKGDSTLMKALEKDKQDSLNASKFFEMYSIWRNKYDSLFEELTYKESQVIISAGKVKKLSDSIHYYIKVNDTLRELTTIGDLLDEDSVLLETLSQAKIEIDSLEATRKYEKDISDSLISSFRVENSSLKNALYVLHVDYVNAVAETNKYIKKTKTNSIWAKVTTVTTAILSVILILKK